MPRGGKRSGAGRRPGTRTVFTRSLKKAIAAEPVLTASRVLEEIRRLATSDVGLCFDEQGRFKPLKDIPPAVRACIASIKTTKKNLTAGDGVQEDVVEIKLWDKVRALEMGAKHHGLLTERIEVTGEVTLADKIARARQRLQKPSK